MNHYSNELKDSLIARMLPPNNVSVADLVRETGIPKDTLYTWRSKAKKGEASEQTTVPGELSSEEKFNVVLETSSLNELEMGEYCRRKGLFAEQVSAWRDVCRRAHASGSPKVERKQLRVLSDQVKDLETELRRKDRALAEAAALLVLQKKVRLLWEDLEDEKPISRSARG